jgi:hypothetical protein
MDMITDDMDTEARKRAEERERWYLIESQLKGLRDRVGVLEAELEKYKKQKLGIGNDAH